MHRSEGPERSLDGPPGDAASPMNEDDGHAAGRPAAVDTTSTASHRRHEHRRRLPRLIKTSWLVLRRGVIAANTLRYGDLFRIVPRDEDVIFSHL